MANYTDLLELTGTIKESQPCVLTDPTPPVVTVVSPAPDTEIGRNELTIFTVTDETAIRDVMVWIEIGGAWEVAYGGLAVGFSPSYSGSSISVISGGYRFEVSRSGGWTAGPTIHAMAFDQGGNQT